MNPLTLKDNGGERIEFIGGGIREIQPGKGRPALFPPHALRRLSRWYEMGATKYGDRNWEKGIPFSSCFDSLGRHYLAALAGEHDEDHLAAIAWNALALMAFEEAGRQDLNDMPWKEETI